MSNDIEKFNAMLERYKLIEPLPPEARKAIIKSKKKIYKRTLKRAGAYSLPFGILSSFFFLLKRMGFSLSFVKAAVVGGIATLLLATVTAGGIYFSLKYLVFNEPKKAVIEKTTDIEPINRNLKKETPLTEKEADKNETAGRFTVKPFSPLNLESGPALRVTDSIIKKLSKLKGSARVIDYKNNPRGKKAGMMILGSVEKVNDKFVISAKVVNVMTSKILFYDQQSVSSPEEIDKACDKITKLLSKSIK